LKTLAGLGSTGLLDAEDAMKRIFRFLIDWLAIAGAGSAAYAATGSFLWMVAAGVAVATYGIWCFVDGTSI
jgi:hypothetical protein